ncbi:hypothetical protein QBC45DRAFT_470437 [Copromyces sp. CBS 386.78]|nr:hypothetical protein QBC45DRAFT_470437 [Copromyces sp. CBS 386.78]
MYHKRRRQQDQRERLLEMRSLAQAARPALLEAPSSAASTGSPQQPEDLAEQMSELTVSESPPSPVGTSSTVSASTLGPEFFQAKDTPTFTPAVPGQSETTDVVAGPSVAAAPPPLPQGRGASLFGPSLLLQQSATTLFGPRPEPQVVPFGKHYRLPFPKPPAPGRPESKKEQKQPAAPMTESPTDVQAAYLAAYPQAETSEKWSDEVETGVQPPQPPQHKPTPKLPSLDSVWGTQRDRLSAKHSQQKADEESALRQESHMKQLQRWKQPDHRLGRAERQRLWKLVSPTVHTTTPFEIQLQSAAWCYQHCLGNNYRVMNEFRKIDDYTGLVVWFEDDFTKLTMHELWLRLSQWIRTNPEMTMSKGLRVEMDRAAKATTIQAHNILATTSGQLPQTVPLKNAKDAAKQAFEEKVNKRGERLLDSGEMPSAAEAIKEFQKLIEEEIKSGSSLTKGEMQELAKGWISHMRIGMPTYPLGP